MIHTLTRHGSGGSALLKGETWGLAVLRHLRSRSEAEMQKTIVLAKGAQLQLRTPALSWPSSSACQQRLSFLKWFLVSWLFPQCCSSFTTGSQVFQTVTQFCSQIPLFPPPTSSLPPFVHTHTHTPTPAVVKLPCVSPFQSLHEEENLRIFMFH